MPKEEVSKVKEADKVMFEIYREAGYDRAYRVVYFTELDERNRDQEISRAMAGEHVADGYIACAHLEDAKLAIAGILERLNDGEALAAKTIAEGLARFRV